MLGFLEGSCRGSKGCMIIAVLEIRWRPSHTSDCVVRRPQEPAMAKDTRLIAPCGRLGHVRSLDRTELLCSDGTRSSSRVLQRCDKPLNVESSTSGMRKVLSQLHPNLFFNFLLTQTCSSPSESPSLTSTSHSPNWYPPRSLCPVNRSNVQPCFGHAMPALNTMPKSSMSYKLPFESAYDRCGHEWLIACILSL